MGGTGAQKGPLEVRNLGANGPENAQKSPPEMAIFTPTSHMAALMESPGAGNFSTPSSTGLVQKLAGLLSFSSQIGATGNVSVAERSYGIEVSRPAGAFLGGSLSPLPHMPDFVQLAQFSIPPGPPVSLGEGVSQRPPTGGGGGGPRHGSRGWLLKMCPK